MEMVVLRYDILITKYNTQKGRFVWYGQLHGEQTSRNIQRTFTAPGEKTLIPWCANFPIHLYLDTQAVALFDVRFGPET